ncbi:MAG: FlgD immunoglobulin-like domain containing protein [Myxococcota bacterium]
MEISNLNALANPQATEVPQEEDPQDLDRDAFMQLLVAQLQNQDPLDPMDSREMITQLSELTSVEELQSMSYRLETLEVGLASIANTQVSSLAGHTVVADSSAIVLDTTGDGSTSFELIGRANEVNVEIRDSAGRLVRTMQLGDTFPGRHEVRWDGVDDIGQRMPPGRYTANVTAKDADGYSVEVSNELTGVVESVSYEHGYPELIVGQSRVLLGDVKYVSP